MEAPSHERRSPGHEPRSRRQGVRTALITGLAMALLGLPACDSLTGPSAGTFTVSGEVVDSASGEAVAGAVLTVTTPSAVVFTETTDSLGGFTIALQADSAFTVAIEVSKDGFTTNAITMDVFPNATVSGYVIELAAVVIVEEEEPDACEAPESCTTQSPWASEGEQELYIDGIFAIWWYPQFDHAADAVTLANRLKAIRRECIDSLGMADPPNPAAGRYYNVYIHHGEEDGFPNGWGNGQGTDELGMPFLTLPAGAHADHGNVLHEGFHIFQYEANAPGFAYQGDSQWYVETAAQWYAATHLPEADDSFVEAAALGANPQLTMWHSFSNEAPGDPTDWLYQVRQYGMHAWLFYLTSQAGVSAELMSNGFYSGTELLPQEYHYQQIGGEALRGYFADWAAHNTGGYDYLTTGQVERAKLELAWVGDPQNVHPYVMELTREEADGSWRRPDEAFTARGWGYNVIHIANDLAGTYVFDLDGDATGSEGATSHFEARLVASGERGTRYASLVMEDALVGTASLQVESWESDIYLVVAAVPEHFRGNQTYGYAVRVSRN